MKQKKSLDILLLHGHCLLSLVILFKGQRASDRMSYTPPCTAPQPSMFFKDLKALHSCLMPMGSTGDSH